MTTPENQKLRALAAEFRSRAELANSPLARVLNQLAEDFEADVKFNR